MKVDYDILRNALLAFKQSGGKWVDLQELTGVHASGIARIAKGEREPNFETWITLHEKAPEQIPQPVIKQKIVSNRFEYDKSKKGYRISGRDKEIAEATYSNRKPLDLSDFPVSRIPIFDLKKGEPSVIDESGYPSAYAYSFIKVNTVNYTPKVFALRIYDAAMAPHLKKRDFVIVDPHRIPQHSSICYCYFPHENSPILIRRYFRYDDTVVLKPNNPDFEEISFKGSERVAFVFQIVQSIINECRIY